MFNEFRNRSGNNPLEGLFEMLGMLGERERDDGSGPSEPSAPVSARDLKMLVKNDLPEALAKGLMLYREEIRKERKKKTLSILSFFIWLFLLPFRIAWKIMSAPFQFLYPIVAFKKASKKVEAIRQRVQSLSNGLTRDQVWISTRDVLKREYFAFRWGYKLRVTINNLVAPVGRFGKGVIADLYLRYWILRRAKNPMQHAKKVARMLLKNGAEKVYLFGGVARSGTSEKDVDIIGIVDHDTAEEFLEALQSYDEDVYYGGSDTYLSGTAHRLELVKTLLGLGLQERTVLDSEERMVQWVQHWSSPQIYGKFLFEAHATDLFLFSEGWRNEESMEQIILAEKCHDPFFIENIAGDALVFNKKKSCFEKEVKEAQQE